MYVTKPQRAGFTLARGAGSLRQRSVEQQVGGEGKGERKE